MITEKERKIQEVLLALRGIRDVLDCGDCAQAENRGVVAGPPSNRIFVNANSSPPEIYVRPCDGHLQSYMDCSWFREVEL